MTSVRPRPTKYRGIEMRSRLEADFAACLDRGGLAWEYEPVCFAGPDGQWLPDFGVTFGARRFYVEVKPESLADVDPVLEQMTVVWLSEPNAILVLVTWLYGDADSSTWFTGRPPENDGDLTWCCHNIAGEGSAWPGMGQFEQTIERIRREHAEAADSGDPPF